MSHDRTARLRPPSGRRLYLALRRPALVVALHASLVVTLAPGPASALEFGPTEAEWATWPEYCRARYVVSGAGVNSTYATRVDPSLAKAWEVRLGPEVWYGLHHFCAGLAFAARAKSITDKTQRERTLQRAIDEYNFTYARMPRTGPMRAEVATRLGLAYGEVAKDDDAVRHFDSAIAACTECESGYLGKAMYLRNRKDLTGARDVMLQGDKATGGLSAQGNYTLGLLFADLLDFEAAREHARKAYKLGYPLPGLRDRLAKAGYPL